MVSSASKSVFYSLKTFHGAKYCLTFTFNTNKHTFSIYKRLLLVPCEGWIFLEVDSNRVIFND